jgi:hypothetical protein
MNLVTFENVIGARNIVAGTQWNILIATASLWKTPMIYNHEPTENESTQQLKAR